MELWFLLAIPVVLMTGWFYTAAVARTQFPTLREKAIVLLIAHPDDEAMFFAPAVLALARPELGNHLKILCLSAGKCLRLPSHPLASHSYDTGNADGLGPIRKQEIVSSALLLGLRSSDDVLVYDDPLFPDSMAKTWSASSVATVLNTFFAKAAPKGRKQVGEEASRGEPPAETTIDVLVTFDGTGISSHPNHISLYHGAVAWVKELMRGKAGWESPVALYTLTSTNIARKYAGVLDAPFTMVSSIISSAKTRDRTLPDRMMFLSDIGAYRKAQQAMTKAHKSQMRWFRWGWIVVGRYMVVNDLKREHVA